jgi:glycine hydroxymethyltransferase
MFSTSMTIKDFDPELHAAIEGERQRQEEHIELIASENYTSPLCHGGSGHVC